MLSFSWSRSHIFEDSLKAIYGKAKLNFLHSRGIAHKSKHNVKGQQLFFVTTYKEIVSLQGYLQIHRLKKQVAYIGLKIKGQLAKQQHDWEGRIVVVILMAR